MKDQIRGKVHNQAINPIDVHLNSFNSIDVICCAIQSKR